MPTSLLGFVKNEAEGIRNGCTTHLAINNLAFSLDVC